MTKERKSISGWLSERGYYWRIVLFVLGSALLAFLVYGQRPADDIDYFESSFLVFAFVNLNIAILCVLIFLVGRNIVKLVFDRKRHILGAKLRQRLVVALVGLTLIPIIILFVLASGLLNRAMEGWFSNQVESAVTSSVEIAKYHYNELERNIKKLSTQIVEELQSKQLSIASPKTLEAYLDSIRKRENLFGLQLYSSAPKVYAEALNAAAEIESFSLPLPDKVTLSKALEGGRIAILEEKGASKFIRVYTSVVLNSQRMVLLLTHRVDPKLSNLLGIVNDSFKEYEQLKYFRNPLRSGYILTLSMITGMILFAAIWFGFYIARELSIPIQRLAEGTREVAKGNYDFQIQHGGDDEIGVLVSSFNKMTKDLKNSRADAESKSLFINTILANLAIGVIATDNAQRITSINGVAKRIWSLKGENELLGKRLEELLSGDNFDQLASLLGALEDDREEDSTSVAEKEFSIISEGREINILATAGRIVDRESRLLGMVLLFDDITELSKAQQMSAWREVARRIAHEIKNPLTPIQLSAQRLQRLFEKKEAYAEGIESTQTIVEHVRSIKRLADEFSNFARMPTAEFLPAALNSIISDIVGSYAGNHNDIVFQFVAEARMPEIYVDQEQIRRVIINILDNAISALRKYYTEEADGRGRIVVKTRYDKRRKSVSFEVSDNGPGINDLDKTRIFQPYYTTKEEGTGLGLAVVTTIVSDHQGTIRVFDNTPKGAKFIVELPVSAKGITQRRFADVAVDV